LVDEDYDYSFFAPLQNAGPGEYGYYARWQNDLCWDTKVADICMMEIVESVGESNLISWVDLEKVRNLLDPKIVEFITKHNITGWNIKTQETYIKDSLNKNISTRHCASIQRQIGNQFFIAALLL
jgi:hypothetical protein